MARVSERRTPNRLRDMDTPETAIFYNKLMNKPSFFNFIAKKIIEFGDNHGEVLDVGCGPGHLLIALGKRAPDLKLHGMDLSENMLDVARKNLDTRFPDRNVSLRQGSMYEMPYDESTFDLVVSSNIIHMSDDLMSMFDEMYRVMKPGAKGMTIGYRRDEPRWVWAFTHAHSRWLERNNKPLDGAGPVLEASYTAGEVSNLLRQSTVTDFRATTSRYLLYVELSK